MQSFKSECASDQKFYGLLCHIIAYLDSFNIYDVVIIYQTETVQNFCSVLKACEKETKKISYIILKDGHRIIVSKTLNV